MANLNDVTKYFPTPSEGYSSTLSSSITAGAAVVSVVSASQYEDGDVVVLIVDPKTVNEAVFTGTKASNPDRFIDCVWTEGNVGVGHAPGAVIADYVTATHLAATTKGLLVSHNQDGTLKDGVVTASKLSSRVLHSGLTGAASITLAESAANFEYIEIFFRNNDGIDNSVKVYEPQGKQVLLHTAWINSTTGMYYIKASRATISGTTLTKTSNSSVNIVTGSAVGGSGPVDFVEIRRVVGYYR